MKTKPVLLPHKMLWREILYFMKYIFMVSACMMILSVMLQSWPHFDDIIMIHTYPYGGIFLDTIIYMSIPMAWIYLKENRNTPIFQFLMIATFGYLLLMSLGYIWDKLAMYIYDEFGKVRWLSASAELQFRLQYDGILFLVSYFFFRLCYSSRDKLKHILSLRQKK